MGSRCGMSAPAAAHWVLLAVCAVAAGCGRPAAGAVPLVRQADNSQAAGPLEVDPCGLAALNASVLRDRPIRVVSIVGRARMGKSFFLSTLAGNRGLFESSDQHQGFTKGLWLHIDGVNYSCDGVASPEEADSSAGDQTSVDSSAVTMFVDSEGLSALGAEEAYDSKIVALAAMISSVFFYNALKIVDQNEIKFLKDMVQFDEVFHNKTGLPLIASRLIWTVQSYYSRTPCEQLLSGILTASGDNDLRRIVTYVEDKSAGQGDHIFCLPHPNRRVDDNDLPQLPLSELDPAYMAKIEELREFVRLKVPEKRNAKGQLMTAGMLAELLYQVVPSLNEYHATARAMIGLQAESMRANVTNTIKQELHALEDSLRGCRDERTLYEVKREARLIAGKGVPLFDAGLLGDMALPENQRERLALEQRLQDKVYASEIKLESIWQSCQPDDIWRVVGVYVMLRYVLQVDVMLILLDYVLEGNILAQLLVGGVNYILTYMLYIGCLAGMLQPALVNMVCVRAVELSAPALGDSLKDVVSTWQTVAAPISKFTGNSTLFRHDGSRSDAELAQHACSQVIGILAWTLQTIVSFWLNHVESWCIWACKELHFWFSRRVLVHCEKQPAIAWISLILLSLGVRFFASFRRLLPLAVRLFGLLACMIFSDIFALKFRELDITSWVQGAELKAALRNAQLSWMPWVIRIAILLFGLRLIRAASQPSQKRTKARSAATGTRPKTKKA